MGFPPSLDTIGIKDINKKTRKALLLLCFYDFLLLFFVKKR